MRRWNRREVLGSLLAGISAGATSRTAASAEGEITGFGYKNAWLAVEQRSADDIIGALGLRDRGEIGWEAGLDRAYEFEPQFSGFGRWLFITPAIDGWTLCVGFRLFAFSKDGAFAKLVLRLSRTLDTTVQYFGTHRIVDGHDWALARHGELIRAYSWLGESGETLLDFGQQTPEEIALGFAFFDERSPEAEDDSYWDREDLQFPREYHVMELAAAWSVAPVDLQGRILPTTVGRLAEF